MPDCKLVTTLRKMKKEVLVVVATFCHGDFRSMAEETGIVVFTVGDVSEAEGVLSSRRLSWDEVTGVTGPSFIITM